MSRIDELLERARARLTRVGPEAAREAIESMTEPDDPIADA